MRTEKKAFFAALAAVLLLAGCTMAPAYERPEAPVPGEFPAYPEYRGVGASEQEADAASLDAQAQASELLPWRDFYRDPKMRSLIALALENNRDLRHALLNVERMRALYQIQRADLLPQLSASGSAANQEGPTFQPPPLPETAISRRYSLNVGITSYELDLFGRVRSLKDAALENYLASESAARSARLTLISETASLYLQLVAAREQYALAGSTYNSRRESHRVLLAMYRQGLASQLTVNQAKAVMEEARVNAVGVYTNSLRLENALTMLLGRSLPPGLEIPSRLIEVEKFLDIPPGLPSQLLERRPDIEQAEHALKAANADIGAARANFFPRIGLTASMGYLSADLDDLFAKDAKTWSFSPQASLPLFAGGRLIAGLEASSIQRDMAVASYEKAIQNAFREVADALAQRSTSNEQLEAARSLRDASKQSYDISNVRYEIGVDSFMNVLDAQRMLFSAQQAYINSELQKEINALSLYKALGGGWGQETEYAEISPAAAEAAPEPEIEIEPEPEPEPEPENTEGALPPQAPPAGV